TEYGRRVKRFESRAVLMLRQYPWPGNVRELRNVIARLMIMVAGDSISVADLAFLDHHTPRQGAADVAASDTEMTLYEARDQFERTLILRTLADQQGNMSR